MIYKAKINIEFLISYFDVMVNYWMSKKFKPLKNGDLITILTH